MPRTIQNLGSKILLQTPGVCAVLFAGTGFYLSEFDPRVRQQIPSLKNQLTHWAKMYQLGVRYMPSLIVIGSLSAFGAYYKTREALWLYGAATLTSVIPFTFLAMMKINNYLNGVLKDTKEQQIKAQDKSTVEEKLKSWVKRHRLRAVLATVSVGIFFWARNVSKIS